MWLLRLRRDGHHVETARKRGLPPPDWFTAAPTPHPGDDFYLEAFKRLSTTRQTGHAIGPIPWTSIMEYVDRHQLSPALAALFVRVIEEMDDGFLAWERSESERRMNAAKKGKG